LQIEELEYVKNKYGVFVMIPKESNRETNLLVLGDY
jgi:hypothetical protein